MLTAARLRRVRLERLASLSAAAAPPPQVARLGAFVRRCVRAFVRSDPWWALSDETIGRRAVMAFAGAVFGPKFLPGTSWGTPALGAVAAVALAAWLERRDRERSDETLLAMPDVLDRMAVCALAGRSVEQALRIVGARARGPVGETMRTSVAILDAGGSRREALDHLVLSPAGDGWAGPVAAMERAERLGVPLADVLVAQARELRSQVRALLEIRVRAAPVKVVFPLVFCFLPAFLVLAVGPVGVSAIRTLTSL